MQPLRIVVEVGEPPNVDGEEIACRSAFDNPFGKCAPGASGTGDAHRVEAGADEEIAQVRRLAKNVVVVGCEAFRSVVELPDTRVRELRNPDQGVFHEDFELVPIVFQKLEEKLVRDTVHRPGFRLGFEAAHHQPASFLLEIDVAVGVAQNGKIGRHVVHRFGDDVHVFGGMKRDMHATHQADLARPLARAVHDAARLDRAVVGNDARHRGAIGQDVGDFDTFEDTGPRHACAFGQGLCDVRRVGLAVAGHPKSALDVVDLHHGPFSARFLGRDDLDRHALGAGGRCRAFQHRHPRVGAGHCHGAALVPTRRQAGFGFEPCVELG